ncbi:HU family DNA-binding protein [Ureaplasma miroungigenitalium]|uniref:HU family DNA-binding protein n=1 Tax=Ureaplasma miroungigenitalium TaxID=1042321 RepID=A0ABT3BM84_9BACT|nr:HU family DNA-binding protein [Ureaplasma miroungigenitalium]MCV3728257.1 HU family DNA-binding protein [Ureaplasma miroungigenitalium]MCV3734062.1 HU family DNA-binding protein [Ureaplasma miroungigenitalium]
MTNQLKPLTRTQIINQVSKMINQDKKTTKEILETYENFLILELARTGVVSLGKIGKFKLSLRKERKGINVFTGEKLIIPEKTVPKFTFTKGIKEIVNVDLQVTEDSVEYEEDEIDNSTGDEFVTETVIEKQE